MPGYLLVKGQFHLFYRGKAGTVPSQPDGDSMWFKPDNPRILKPDGKRLAKFNGGGFVQLRFEAIDALETHYHGAAQMDSPGKAARDFVLKAAGFKRVAFGSGKGLGVKSAEPHPVPGHILTHGLDDHGRPVSFVFAGKTPQPDGGRAWIVEPDLARSINAGLVKACLVYPMFYLSLPPDLRGPFEDWFKRAQVAKKGVWAEDVTTRGASVPGLSRLEELAMWPKLFRRLVDYFKEGRSGLAGFRAWLKEDPDTRNDELAVPSEKSLLRLDEIVDIHGNMVKLKHDPLNLLVK